MNRAAQALGRLGKGVPRRFTPAQLDAAKARLAAARYRGGRKPRKTRQDAPRLTGGTEGG
jgi:hypothetical protein